MMKEGHKSARNDFFNKALFAVLISHFLFASWTVSFQGESVEFVIGHFHGWEQIETKENSVDLFLVNKSENQKIAFICDSYYEPITSEDYNDAGFWVACWQDVIDNVSLGPRTEWECIQLVPVPKDKVFYAVFENKGPKAEFKYAAIVVASLDETHVITGAIFLNSIEKLPDECIELLDSVWLVSSK